MDCPKCEADMKILDYQEYGNLLSDGIVREWECRCPNCGYKGTYSVYYEPISKEWNYVDEVSVS